MRPLDALHHSVGDPVRLLWLTAQRPLQVELGLRLGSGVGQATQLARLSVLRIAIVQLQSALLLRTGARSKKKKNDHGVRK